MPVDRWPDLVGEFGDPAPPSDLREQVERRAALMQAHSGGASRWSPRWSSAGRWLAAGLGIALVIVALAAAAHSRGQAPASGQHPAVEANVVLTGQQGTWNTDHVAAWRTLQRASVTCGTHPAITSTAGNNGIRPSDLCRALAYYPAHSSDSRCSYTSIKGPVVPRRVVITGTINGEAVHLNMGLRCNPPAKLAQTTGLIWATVFGYPTAVKATISEATFGRLTQIAQREAQSLGDARVQSAEVVLTTRRRMNKALGFGYQSSQDQNAKVFVIQLRGTFTCNECHSPPNGSVPTGSAAQDVLTFGSLTTSDFGITPNPVVMQRMGPVMRLTWQPVKTKPSRAGGHTISDNGVSLSLPAGWQGRALPGRLQIRNSSRGGWGAPSAGQVWAVLDEVSKSFAASDRLPYPTLAGQLRIAPGEFSAGQLAGGDWSAARLFQQNGRYFELAVIYGDKHPAPTVVEKLDQVLAMLVIRPASIAPATLQPPEFTAATGWHTGSSPATPAQPQGDQLCAWASMIPYRDSNTCPIPGRTIGALKPGQMVISVDAYRDWTHPIGLPLPEHLVVPSALTTQAEGGYQSALITGHTGQYSLQIDVYVGHNQPFTAAMRAQAQHELDGLHLPRWPAPAR